MFHRLETETLKSALYKWVVGDHINYFVLVLVAPCVARNLTLRNLPVREA